MNPLGDRSEKIPKVFFTDPIENFNFSKISADILTDICIWSNDIPSGYASNSPICQDRAIKQKALLSEKYKDCNMYVLRPKVDKKV
jgi:hypothetical protein